MTEDPIRLLDDVTASAGLRRDLAAAVRHRAPYDVSAGAARFEASLAKGAGAASSGWGAGALGVGALILGGLIGAGVWLSQPAAPIEPPPAGSGVAAASARALPASREHVLEDMSDRAAAPAPTSAGAPAPALPVVGPTPLEVEADRSEAPGEPASAKKARSRRPPARSGDREVVRAGSADYLREARSLQAARGFLGRDPAEALARAEAGAAEFRAGAFAQEWEGVAILALFALERRTEAERRASAFLGRYPNGPYAAQVRDALDRP